MSDEPFYDLLSAQQRTTVAAIRRHAGALLDVTPRFKYFTLAQCNTFILHRIVNDDDQKLVSRLVPDALGGLLKELSSLPSRRAILLGWATPMPTLVDIYELERKRRPRSADPDFWDVWTGKAKRHIDWSAVAQDWLNAPPPAADLEPSTEPPIDDIW